ncbi:MAG: ribonuclease III [Clostridiales bacterium]|nr:ribonuclease III [Clostridiales bacterium]MBO4747792.1 ribonuclease III [Clostridiales bacterium]MBR4818645.1 ribonuclease III [Clostridiales bacterium]MBR5041258.1 ribonuclease III [Clostridiales bacterium]MBR5056969.1 ribonuclease III [Clostridiales bacterium]
MMIPIPPEDIREVPTSVLAYVGDAVYELHIRMHIVACFGGQSGVLHKKAVRYVSAPAQAHAIRVLHDELSEEEQNVFRRGKNGHQGSMAKNASPADYKYATGLETLIGYLYLSGKEERMEELIRRIIEIVEESA